MLFEVLRMLLCRSIRIGRVLRSLLLVLLRWRVHRHYRYVSLEFVHHICGARSTYFPPTRDTILSGTLYPVVLS
jgi:hypothetical protein